MSRKLLLVEDEAIVALNEKRILERNGFEVEVVHSGENAVARIQSASPLDLVLMDIDLGSGMDGTEAARRILEIHELPIVFNLPTTLLMALPVNRYRPVGCRRPAWENTLVAQKLRKLRLHRELLEFHQQGCG